jgi:hypothetical protein
VTAFARAISGIPSVQGVRLGRRVRHGAGYEAAAPDAADYVAIVEFENRAGLERYLTHPLHGELGIRFGFTIAAAMVYDFEMFPADRSRVDEALRRLIEAS